MIDPQDELALDNFFKALSGAMSEVSLSELLAFYHVPCVFVSNEDKTICSTTEEVTQRLAKLFERCQQANAIQHEANIVHAMKLSDSVLFAKVNWDIKNRQNDVCLTCSTSYTVEKGGEFGFDIIVSVIDEEERAIEDICSTMGE
ncbi:hypothetical protein [Alteromonas facilis]|uniref:hypothetical protein n=1 Tax=Alteromonas facilis TaxID=2048004 RepID=UPI000C28BB85|nr:hypothetical protein [Alteromonas facilis]